MPPHSSPTDPAPTHDIVLSDGVTTIGLNFAKSPANSYRAAPASNTSKLFKSEQVSWVSGRGKELFSQEPTGFMDSRNMWTMTEGKIYPVPKWEHAYGLQTELFKETPYNGLWLDLYGNNRYIAQSFAPAVSFSANSCDVYIKKIGSPGDLYMEWCSDNAGKPGTVLKTTYLSTSISFSYDINLMRYVFSMASSQTFTAATTYWVKIYGAVGDDSSNHWRLSVDDGNSTPTGKYSSDGSTWSNGPGFTMRLYIPQDRQLFPFYLWGSYYVATNDYGANKLFINGDRGLATIFTSQTIGTGGKTWETNRWGGAYIRIIDGTGDGQVRQILSNTGTTLTVATNWSITPDATSQYVIYATRWWTEITGHGLTNVKCSPVVVNKIAYFPQGGSTAIRKMRWSAAGAYGYSADATVYYDLMVQFTHPTTGVAEIAGLNFTTCEFRENVLHTTDPWANNLTQATQKYIGETDYRITNGIQYNGKLYIFKEDSLWYIDSTYMPLKVNFGGLDSAPSTSNGASACIQNLYLYFIRNGSVVQMLGSNAADIENYRTGHIPLDYNSQGDGVVISAEGWLFRSICCKKITNSYVTVNPYEKSWNCGESRVMAWNDYGWHEILRGYSPNMTITNMFWQPCEQTNSMLWTVMDGTMVYQRFPKNTSNPMLDSSINYVMEGTLDTVWFDVNEPSFRKFFNRLNFIGDGELNFYYRTYDAQQWIYIGNFGNSPIFTNGMKIQLRIIISTSYTYPATKMNSFLKSFSIDGNMIEPIKYQWAITASIESDAEDLQGGEDIAPDTVETAINSWADYRTSLSVSSTKSTLHGKTVNIEPYVESIQSIDTEEGSSKWKGTIWFTIREN